MKISSVKFIGSSPSIEKCPTEKKIPEYAFVGRSNVGKSSLINFLTNSKIAKISSTPGKTQLINHFLINNQWYLVDLPGYGYAKVSKKTKAIFNAFTKKYLKYVHKFIVNMPQGTSETTWFPGLSSGQNV